MQERRNPLYTFTSNKALIQYFSNFIPKEEVISNIELLRKEFKERSGTSRVETRYQFLKKCECHLLNIVKSE